MDDYSSSSQLNYEIPMACERNNVATQPNNKRKRKMYEIKNEENLNMFDTVFSKRKFALINKVMEISILCQTKAALIVKSPDNKLYACGYPNCDAVIQRFLTGDKDYDERKKQEDDDILETLRFEYEAIQEKLQEQKEKLQAVTEEAKKSNSDWWNHSIDDMDLGSLQEFKTSLENLKLNLVAAIEEKKFNIDSI